jgi:hypothetical protein
MPTPHDKERRRVSSQRAAAARDHAHDSADHIESSRKAISRSLDLLSITARQVPEA